MFRKIMVFCLVIGFFSCEKDECFYYKKVIKQLIKERDITGVNHVVLIPNQGCSGCLSAAANFFKVNINSLEHTDVIFINVTDEKLLKIKLGEKFIKNPHVFITKKGDLFDIPDIRSIYPVLLKLENKKVISCNDFDSSNWSELN